LEAEASVAVRFYVAIPLMTLAVLGVAHADLLLQRQGLAN
jgi:hypothetical protein